MRRTTRFRQLLNAPEILVMPGAPDMMAARIVEATGFQAMTNGGYSISAHQLGKPDIGLVSYSEMVSFYDRLCDATALPVFADADTGYGNVSNVARTVRGYERAGVAGLFIEDQVSPKRCGHMAGKQVVPIEEFIAKIKSALDARSDPDLVIMARSDALAPHGLDEAIDRLHLAREAGADMLFIDALESVEQMRRFCREAQAPTLANMIEGGKSPALTTAELQEIGFSAVVCALAPTYAIAQTLQQLYATLARDGTTAAFRNRMLSFDQFNDLIGLQGVRGRENELKEFADKLVGGNGARNVAGKR